MAGPLSFPWRKFLVSFSREWCLERSLALYLDSLSLDSYCFCPGFQLTKTHCQNTLKSRIMAMLTLSHGSDYFWGFRIILGA
jgi:hypothetical protein